MDDLRVPTTSLPVEILCADGHALLGDIFLPAHSALQEGPMRPEEWIETVLRFFPFRLLESRALAILNRTDVVSVTVPAGSNAAADAACPDTPVVRIAVEAGGTRFEGNVLVDMPPDHQRIVDWLNAPAAFFTVRTGSAHHLIQKRHVTRVVELCRLAS